MKSARTNEVQNVTNLRTVSYRRDSKIRIQMDKCNIIDMHPMKGKLDDPVLERFKRSSVVHFGGGGGTLETALRRPSYEAQLHPLAWEQTGDNSHMSPSRKG